MVFLCVFMVAAFGIAVEDFKHRSFDVFWVLPLYGAGLGVLYAKGFESWEEILVQAGLALCLLLLCGLIAAAIKGLRFWETFKVMGLGDLVILPPLCVIFKLKGLLWLFVLTSLIGLIFSLYFKKHKVPFAGILLILCLPFQLFGYYLGGLVQFSRIDFSIFSLLRLS